jgi:TonB family protein
MSGLPVYMMKTAIYLITFYSIYSFLLKKDTALSRNRAYILLSVAVSLLIPFITVKSSQLQPIGAFGKLLAGVTISSFNVPVSNDEPSFSGLRTLYLVYFAGTSLFLLKFIIEMLSLSILIIRIKEPGKDIVKLSNTDITGFSALGHIFINQKLSPEEAREIINHERNHLKKNHYADIIIMELLIAFQWFNPVVYLLSRELRAIHEFQADRDCIKSGISVLSYQKLLLSQVFGPVLFRIPNCFSNPSLIKQRIVMMNREPSWRFAGLKMLTVLPAAGLIFMSLNITEISSVESKILQNSENRNIPPSNSLVETPDPNEIPFVVVEEMPMFPGGDAALLRFIAENISYPETAKINNIQGRVIIRFCVTAKGGVSQVSVLKGVDPELDAEAIRVVSSLPAFKPGRQGGNPVPVWYMVPITFTLK